MDEASLKWEDGGSYIEHTHWSTCKEKTCYFVFDNSFSDIEYFSNKCYKIYKASDFIEQEFVLPEK